MYILLGVWEVSFSSDLLSKKFIFDKVEPEDLIIWYASHLQSFHQYKQHQWDGFGNMSWAHGAKLERTGMKEMGRVAEIYT